MIKTKAAWEQNNSKVLTWIPRSIVQNIVIILRSLSKAFEMWDYLKKLYHQTNNSREFCLDTEFPKSTQVIRKCNNIIAVFSIYGMRKIRWL